MNKRINKVRDNGVVVREISESMFNKLLHHKSIRIMVGGRWIQLQRQNLTVLKEIEKHKEEIRKLKSKLIKK